MSVGISVAAVLLLPPPTDELYWQADAGGRGEKTPVGRELQKQKREKREEIRKGKRKNKFVNPTGEDGEDILNSQSE